MNFVATVLPRLALGLLISSVIGLVAYRRGSLSRSGVLGAVITGTTIFGFGGFTSGMLLVAFFVSSSVLSHFKQDSQQKQRAAEMFDKGGQRDIWQALANGGAAAGFALLLGLGEWLGLTRMYVNPHPAGTDGDLLPSVLTMAIVGALATVNADTWATELGVLQKGQPRLVTTMQSVQPGTSGGISWLGTLSAFGGSLFIGLIFVITSLPFTSFSPGRFGLTAWITVIMIAVAGLIGSLFDSFLGATAQAIYYNEARQKETEKAIEPNGTPNKHLRGWRWLNNDWVNFISSVVGALVSAFLVILIL